MENPKVIVLAEALILPGFLAEVTALAAATLTATLKEPGCEAFYQTTRVDNPNALVFFEVFSSKQALDDHMEAGYTKAFFAGMQGKLAGSPVTTILSEL